MVDRVLSSSKAPSVTPSILPSACSPQSRPTGPSMLAKGTYGYSPAHRIGDWAPSPSSRILRIHGRSLLGTLAVQLMSSWCGSSIRGVV
jgi:hypothetical protein